MGTALMLLATGCPNGGGGSGSGGSEGTGTTVLYTANNGSNTVSGFVMNAQGILTATTPPTVATGGTNTQWIAVTHNGQFLYVSNQGSANLPGYTITSTTGVLTATSPATFSTGGGSAPQGLTVSPNGQFLYVANTGTNTVAGFSIGAGGVLAATTPATFPTGGTSAGGIAIAPNGQVLYVANAGTNDASGFTIGAGGVLTSTTPATFSTGAASSPVGLAITRIIPSSTSRIAERMKLPHSRSAPVESSLLRRLRHSPLGWDRLLRELPSRRTVYMSMSQTVARMKSRRLPSAAEEP